MLTTLSRLALTAAVAFAALTPVHADTTLHGQIPLKNPRKEPPRLGGPLDKVEIDIWLPDSKAIRGVVINPFNTGAAQQKHWQEAARLWDFAVIGANYFGVKREEFAPTLQQALDEFAAKTDHPELKSAPMCFVGMSAGAGMSMHFADAFPDRTIALGPVCLEVGPKTAETRQIPTVTVFGEKDGKQMEKLAESLPQQRAQGAQWATAVQWRRRHEFALANNLVMPLFDHTIRFRLGGKGGLKDYDVKDGWLGDRGTWDTTSPKIYPYAEYPGDKDQACWLPDSYTAHVWQAFVSQNPGVKIASPPGLGDGQPFLTHAPGEPVQVKVTDSGKGQVKKLQLFDGDRPLATSAAAPAEMTVRLDPGVHALIAVATYEDGRQVVSRPHTIIVTGKE